MKRLVISLMVCVVGPASAQHVAILYDAGMPTLGLNDGPGFANLLVQSLQNKGVTAKVVNNAGLAEYMKANREGVMLVCQGIMPGTIFQNRGKDDLVYSWLREGGIGGFVGDYPFYYWDNTGNVAGGGGQRSVFGATVTNGTVATVSPTDKGKKIIPSLGKWTTNRPVGLAALQNNGFEFESYADDGTNADPIIYRTKDMKGWFVNFHTSCCGTAVPPNEQMAKEYAELISNRFPPKARAVDPRGRLATTWGRVRSWR
jgi:hypothetical protein